MNAGKIFEELVDFLTRHLHKRAKVSYNVRLPDKITNQSRQIDVLIELDDGPSKFRAIVEARERSRPVGVEYIEQIKSKRDSVGAHKAIIVSNKGFAKTALTKAAHYGIETLTLADALSKDWPSAFNGFRSFEVRQVTGQFSIEYLTPDGFVIKPHHSLIDDLAAHGNDAVIARSADQSKAFSAKDLILAFHTSFKTREIVNERPGEKIPFRVAVDIGSEAGTLYFRNEQGEAVPFTKCGIEGEIWLETIRHTPSVMQYREEPSGKILAEIASAATPDIPFDVLVTPSQNENEGSVVSLRWKRRAASSPSHMRS